MAETTNGVLPSPPLSVNQPTSSSISDLSSVPPLEAVNGHYEEQHTNGVLGDNNEERNKEPRKKVGETTDMVSNNESENGKSNSVVEHTSSHHQQHNSKNGQIQFNPYLPSSGAASISGSSSPNRDKGTSSRLSLHDVGNTSQALSKLKNINDGNSRSSSTGSFTSNKAATVTASSFKRNGPGTSSSGMILIGSRLPAATPSPVAPALNSSINSSKAESEHLQKLSILKDLMDQGYLSVEEYSQRKSQIIDQITGTGSGTAGPRKSRLIQAEEIPHRPPPDFSLLPSERAIKHTFDPITQSWIETDIRVKLDDKPFAKGGLRYAYYMKVDSASRLETVIDPLADDSDNVYVAKISIDPEEDRDSYFQDVEIQMYAKEWAKKFNSYRPPKKVEFLKAYVLELVDRETKPICGVERYIAGEYRKHNNNYGYVSEDERNTPQAFSHFTIHGSNHTVLVCDIQGVGDMYTDPQMHTINEGFGKGNLGQRGFDKFLQSHRCNAICRYLRLPAINAKQIDEGTKPAQTFMDRRQRPTNSLSEYYLPPSNLAQVATPERISEPPERSSETTPLLDSSSTINGDPHYPYDTTCCCTIT